MKKHKKIILTVCLSLLAFIALWFSFYTEPLSEHLRRQNAGQFNAEQYAEEGFRQTDKLTQEALPVGEFLSLSEKDKQRLVNEYGKVLGIGSNYFFVVKGKGTVIDRDDEEMIIESEDMQFRIPIRHVFGNLARDASGWFDIDAFPTITDFNSVSAAVNKHIEEQVLTEEIRGLSPGKTIVYCAAVEVNREYIENVAGVASFADQPLLIPYLLAIQK